MSKLKTFMNEFLLKNELLKGYLIGSKKRGGCRDQYKKVDARNATVVFSSTAPHPVFAVCESYPKKGMTRFICRIGSKVKRTTD